VKKIFVLVIFGITVSVGIVVFLGYNRAEAPVSVDTTLESDNVQFDEPVASEDAVEPAFDALELQSVLDSWVAEQSGSAGVVIRDTDRVYAQHNPKKTFFAASIYKMYVAYEGYRLVDAGEAKLNEPYQADRNRGQCLDLMIRESDSPCAEKMWAEIGRQNITEALMSYGISGTDMLAITTTAEDAAVLTARIISGEGLSLASQESFLASMREQIYQDALGSGFSSAVTLFNKVGFNGLVEYHDVGFIRLSDGREIIISVFTENVGTTQIAALAGAIEKAISSQSFQ
jgi:hypothetical protein